MSGFSPFSTCSSGPTDQVYPYNSIGFDKNIRPSPLYDPKQYESSFQVYRLNNQSETASQFENRVDSSSPEFNVPQQSFDSGTDQTDSKPLEKGNKRSKFQKQLDDSTFAGSGEFPASREPDLVCDAAHDSCLARTNHLALGMLRILDKYSQACFTPKTNTLLPASSVLSRRFSSETPAPTDLSAPNTIHQIKYDLTTTLRNTIPLNHLQKIAKHHDLDSILWFPCNFPNCFNVYQNRRSLRRHIFSHTGETPHSCQFPGCNKAYTSSDRLKEHIHSHTNRRPYKCNVLGCTKAYNDSKTLREHKLTHGEKKFQCEAPGCRKSFHRKTHLKQHMQTHSRDLAI